MILLDTLRVDIEEEDITEGQKRESTRIFACPFARAAIRVNPNISYVGGTFIHTGQGDKISLPHEVQEYIANADFHASYVAGTQNHTPGKRPQPATFTIPWKPIPPL